MKKNDILTKIEATGILAVVREATAETALEAAEAVILGGITGIEVTFTVPKAAEVIAELKERYKEDPQVIIGAGTVLEEVTAHAAIQAGAQFIVSPTFDQRTAEMCHLNQVPYIPGCMSVTEMQEALKSGVDIVKLFPANCFGPKMIQSVKGPLPQINIMPSGGVSIDNIAEWKQAGAVAVGVGGSLFSGAADGNFEQIRIKAEAYQKKWHQAKRG